MGEVLRDELGMRLEFVRTLDTDIEDAWSALTVSERSGRWFGTWTGDPSDGHVEVVMTAEDDDTPQRVDIVECVEPTLLALDMPTPDGVWKLVVQLTANGDSTRLVFTHRLAEPYDASQIGPGWHYYLDRLHSEISGGEKPEAFDPYLEGLSNRYPVPTG